MSMNRRRRRLSLKNDEKLLDLAALAFDGIGLYLLDLVVQLELLFGLVCFSDAIIRDAKPIVGLAQLRVGGYGLGVIGDRLVVVAAREIE